MPADVVEEAGKRVTATVDGRRVIVGAGRLSSDAPPWANLPVFDDFRPYSGRVVTKVSGVAGERRDCAWGLPGTAN